jgi:hypothetical protein
MLKLISLLSFDPDRENFVFVKLSCNENLVGSCYSLRLGPVSPSVVARHLSPLAAHVGPTSFRPWASQSCLSVLPVQYSHPVVQYSLVNSDLGLFVDPR